MNTHLPKHCPLCSGLLWHFPPHQKYIQPDMKHGGSYVIKYGLNWWIGSYLQIKASKLSPLQHKASLIWHNTVMLSIHKSLLASSHMTAIVFIIYLFYRLSIIFFFSHMYEHGIYGLCMNMYGHASVYTCMYAEASGDYQVSWSVILYPSPLRRGFSLNPDRHVARKLLLSSHLCRPQCWDYMSWQCAAMPEFLGSCWHLILGTNACTANF